MRSQIKSLLLLVFVSFALNLWAQTSKKESIATAWGNYVNTNIYGYGNMILQVQINGQNSVWSGLFSVSGTNAYTPNIAYNNVKLISYSVYNTTADDVQVLLMSTTSTTGFGGTTIVIKTGTPALGAADIYVTATGEAATLLSLTNNTTAPFAYTIASSAGTQNTWTVNNNFGIGNSNPQYKLDVAGDSRISGALILEREGVNGMFRVKPSTGTGVSRIMDFYENADAGNSAYSVFGIANNAWAAPVNSTFLMSTRNGTSSTTKDIMMWANDLPSAYNAALTIKANTGNIGIGTTAPGQYKLAVEGTIGARKVKVTQSSWADYVFENNYKLPTLKEVELFIRQNKHLPGVPSAKEVGENGLDLGDNQAVLLKKIEELTLYILEQNKQIENLEKSDRKKDEILISLQKQIEEIREGISRTKNK